MCRILISDKKGLMKLGKDKMLEFLDVLEKSCGGHGNGVLFIDNGQVTKSPILNKEISPFITKT